MSDLQSSHMRLRWQTMSALSVASAPLSKLWIPFLNNHLLDGDLCKNFLFPYFLLFFWFSIMILS